jgi:hypothetical protein
METNTSIPAAADILPITGTPLPDVDFDAPFIASKRGDFEYARLEYEQAAGKAKTGEEKRLLESVAVICGFATNFDSIQEPYQPMFRAGDRRSAIPDDLSAEDLGTVKLLLAKSKVPLLRARLGDILWIRQKDHVAAKVASTDYLAAAHMFLGPEDWFFSKRYFQRALQLGHRLGRKNEAWIAAEAATVAALNFQLKDTEPLFISHILDVLEEVNAGVPATNADHARSQAEKAAKEKDGHRTRTYYEQEAKFRRLAKDTEREKTARLAAAAGYEMEAQAALARKEPSYLAASHFLALGVEALRRAQADQGEIGRLKGLLLNYQQESVKEMKVFEYKMDLSAPAEQAAKLVTHDDLQEALKRLALGRPFTAPDSLRAEVLKLAEDFPISNLFGSSVVDQAGRVTEHLEGLVGAQASEQESAIEGRMFRHAAQFNWNVRAHAFIEPARQQIWKQHHPQQSALTFLVLNNPFVPPGHENIFLRGLYYGLCGDMLLAAHLLAPQVEQSIRYVLEQNGVDVSNLESDLTQPVKTLGPLLTMPQTKAAFGEDCVFELRGLLIEKLGYSWRHRIAHGFATEGECYDAPTSNLWWVVLRLCYMCLVLRENAAKPTQSPAQADLSPIPEQPRENTAS